MTNWIPDELGDGYEQRTIPLGADPDGEGDDRGDPGPDDAARLGARGRDLRARIQ